MMRALSIPLGLCICSTSFAQSAFVRGDSNADSTIDLADGVFVFSYLFLAGDEPSCMDAGDSNDDGLLDLSDGVYLLNALFLGGIAIPFPFPRCGKDDTDDSLICWRFPQCGLSDNQRSANAGIRFLAELMDRDRDRLLLYTDVGAPGSSFVALAKIPNADAPVAVNGSWPDESGRSASVLRCEFTGPGFGGFFFLNGTLGLCERSPGFNFGEVCEAGVNLSGAISLRFRARGQRGGERIEFVTVHRLETTPAGFPSKFQ